MIIGGHSVVCAVLAVAWLLCVGVDSSIAAPSISSVSGTVANGQAITITGSSFGAGPNVLLFDDFEKGTNGNSISTGSGSAEVGQWNSVTGMLAVPVYSNAQKVSGNLSALMVGGANGDYYNRLIAAIPSATQVFVSSWMWIDYMPVVPGLGVNWKSIWMMDTGTADKDLLIPLYLGGAGSQTGSFTGEYGGNWLNPYADYSGPTLTTGHWLRTWIFADGTSDGKYVQSWELTSSGVVQDATSANSNPNVCGNGPWFNFTGGSSSWQTIYFNGYMPDGYTQGQNSHAHFDDIYIATGPNAMARVEIGNASTYKACTNLTIVTPTSWSASSITATVRQGSFGSSGSAYLYVLDASGTPNANGYPITFGGGSTAPAIPTGLHQE
jgi:hypothetical protein